MAQPGQQGEGRSTSLTANTRHHKQHHRIASSAHRGAIVAVQQKVCCLCRTAPTTAPTCGSTARQPLSAASWEQPHVPPSTHHCLDLRHAGLQLALLDLARHAVNPGQVPAARQQRLAHLQVSGRVHGMQDGRQQPGGAERAGARWSCSVVSVAQGNAALIGVGNSPATAKIWHSSHTGEKPALLSAGSSPSPSCRLQRELCRSPLPGCSAPPAGRWPRAHPRHAPPACAAGRRGGPVEGRRQRRQGVLATAVSRGAPPPL